MQPCSGKWPSLCDPRTPIARGIEGRRLQTRIEPNIEMKVLTQVGLDREAVGEPEGGERVFANFKQVMFMAQLLIRRTLWKL